jgi:hypothetical protein
MELKRSAQTRLELGSMLFAPAEPTLMHHGSKCGSKETDAVAAVIVEGGDSSFQSNSSGIIIIIGKHTHRYAMLDCLSPSDHFCFQNPVSFR